MNMLSVLHSWLFKKNPCWPAVQHTWCLWVWTQSCPPRLAAIQDCWAQSTQAVKGVWLFARSHFSSTRSGRSQILRPIMLPESLSHQTTWCIGNLTCLWFCHAVVSNIFRHMGLKPVSLFDGSFQVSNFEVSVQRLNPPVFRLHDQLGLFNRCCTL